MIEMLQTRRTARHGLLERGERYSEERLGKLFCEQLVVQGLAKKASKPKTSTTPKTEGDSE